MPAESTTWLQGEVHPTGRDWLNAPDVCEADHEYGVQVLVDRDGRPANTLGRAVLYCEVCDQSWHEPLENIKESPWSAVS